MAGHLPGKLAIGGQVTPPLDFAPTAGDVFNRRIARAVDTTNPFDLEDAAIERYILDDASGVMSLDGGKQFSRFDDYAPNQQMLDRLRRIERGELTPTQTDLNFYSHEPREFVRYRRQGWRTGVPDDLDARHTLWENSHTATLEDYRLREGPGVLYVPE